MKIRKDIHGVEVKIGDVVSCYDSDGDSDGYVIQELIGKVSEKDGVILVGDNDLAIRCAEYVEIL